MIIRLTTPITAHGATVAELTIPDEPTMGQLWDAPEVTISKGGNMLLPRFGAVLELAARLAGVPPSAMKALSRTDGQAVYAAVLPFVLPGQQDGSAPVLTSPSAEA